MSGYTCVYTYIAHKRYRSIPTHDQEPSILAIPIVLGVGAFAFLAS